MTLKITLLMNGKPKTFTKTATARLAREAWENRANYYDDEGKLRYGLDVMDALVNWLVGAFGNQFTADDFWDGFDGGYIDVLNMQSSVITAVAGEVLEIPKQVPEATK